MDSDPDRDAYRERMNLVADMLGVPDKGRQSAFGRLFGVTPKGARKWLTGEGYPEMDKALQICARAGVNLNWLIQGTPPMRGHNIDPHVLSVAEAIDALPLEPRSQLLGFLRYQVTSQEGWFTREQVAHYLRDLDAVQSRSRAPAQAGATAPTLHAAPALVQEEPAQPYDKSGKRRQAA